MPLILLSSSGGPTFQHVLQKENQLIMIFNSNSDKEKAKAII